MAGKMGACRRLSRRSCVPPPLISDDSDDLAETKPGRTSFFKVMINDLSRYQYLTIPPGYVPHLYHLVGHNVQLKDSLGRIMEVGVSNVAGSLAFVQGWRDFVSAHKLIWSDILVFHPVGKSLFEVEIFDASGCTRLKFDEVRKDCRISQHKGHDLSSSMHPVAQSKSVAADGGVVRPTKPCQIAPTNGKILNDGDWRKDSCYVAPADGKYCRSVHMKNHVATSQYEDHVPQVYAAASKEDDVQRINFEIPDSVKLESAGSDDDYDLSGFSSFSLTISTNDKIVELPESLPLSRISTGRTQRHGTLTIILKDSSMRMWPVLYEHNSRSTRLLAGWDAFAEANLGGAGRETIGHFRKIDCCFSPAAFQVTCPTKNSQKAVGGDFKEASTWTRKNVGEDLKRVARKCPKLEGVPPKRRF